MFDFSNYSKSKYFDDSKKLVFDKLKDEKGGVLTDEFFISKTKIYQLLVGDSSKYNKARVVNRHIVATITHNEYKDVLLNKKYLRRLMDSIQNKDYRIGTCEINKISLSCFDDKIHILDNWYNRLALG